LSPGRSARVLVGGETLGLIGALHPEVAVNFDLEGEYYVGELLLCPLLEQARSVKEYRPVGRFPNVKVDIALVVDEAVDESLLESEITRRGGEYLVRVVLFDVYRGQQIPDGKKSLAFALEFGSAERTLTDEETHLEVRRIIGAVERAFGAELRGKRPGVEEAT
jgi:phenylalanyl-tRNA synthetase beta chain